MVMYITATDSSHSSMETLGTEQAFSSSVETGNQVVVPNCDMTYQQPGPMMC